MKPASILLLAVSVALGNATPQSRGESTPAFFLAGDSTTAAHGGWGDCFLKNNLANSAWGKNFAHSGATTASFESGGHWHDMIEAVKNAGTAGKRYVVIQFGHNDQKRLKMDEFKSNLRGFVSKAKEVGATPILVTSLTRREFAGGVLDDSLANVREATIKAAAECGAEVLHLNEESAKYITAIGKTDAYKYNLDRTDRTRLNDEGCSIFGAMMAKLMMESDSSRSEHIMVDSHMMKAIEEGVYYSH